jgi:hypothetical protein
MVVCAVFGKINDLSNEYWCPYTYSFGLSINNFFSVTVSLRDDLKGLLYSLRDDLKGLLYSLRDDLKGLLYSLRDDLKGLLMYLEAPELVLCVLET